MNYVVDSSVAFKWLVVEPDTDQARQLRDEYQLAVHDLLAPAVFPIEITHALTRAERQGRITQNEGAQLFKDMLKTLPQLFDSLRLLPRAYEISSTMRVGVYDCLYVALAERDGCDFVSADDKLLKNLQPTFPFIKSLALLPGPPQGPTP